MKNLFFTLLAVCTLASCSSGNDDNGDGDKAIQIESGQTSQVVFADNSAGGGVTFKTTGAWTSSISESTPTRVGTPDWVTIDPASGSAAGSYTINITLDNNYTGSKRTATITINCGGDKITISITQDGKTEAGVVNKLVSGIERTGDSGKVTFLFNYDEKGRIAEYFIQSAPNSPTYKYYFSYNIAGEVRIKADSDTENWIAYLNSDGFAHKIMLNDGYHPDENEYSIQYSNGYISQESWKDYSDETEVNYYSWSNGNFQKSWYEVNEFSYETGGHIIVPKSQIEYTTYTTITNDRANIDFNMLIQTLGGRSGSCNGDRYSSDTYNRDCLDILSLFGFLGKRSTNFVKEFPKEYENFSAQPTIAKGMQGSFAIPTAEYTLNADNSVAKIVYHYTFKGTTADLTINPDVTDTYTISYK